MKLRWVKFAAFVVIVIGAAAAVQLTGVFQDLDFARVQSRVDELGVWGPLGFVLIYAGLILAFTPGTIITVLGATLFPLWEAFLLVIAGAMLGATLSFVLGRTLGRDAVRSVLEGSSRPAVVRVRDWTGVMERRGLMAVAYLRIAYVPFSLLNYLAPLTPIRFRDYFIGTILGIVPGTFVFVFMGNTLRAAWETGQWGALWSWKAAVSIVLFALSLALPVVLQRVVEPGDLDP